MTEPVWMYVVHATRQQWLVDMFEEAGRIPVALKRVESPYCPRGKVFLLPDPESYLNTLQADPLWPGHAKEFASTWHEREMERLIQRKITEAVTDPKSLVKIANLA